MKIIKQIIKDLPIYLNGFSVTLLFASTKAGWYEYIMVIIACISFFKYGEMQKEASIPKSTPKPALKFYVIFNVDTFNTWFNDTDNNAIYANPGIFLRLDKLSSTHIEDYIEKCHGLSLSDWDLTEKIHNFHEEIRKDWIKKINNKF